jgi:DNA-binding PucR family transcriptional regulator
VGIEVQGLSNIHKSFHRARTAMKMAMYRNVPFIQFEEMGFYKILFSVKDEEVLYSYANEILAPLDAYDSGNHNYIELLKVYIQNDRSLEKTAAAMYLHRNTVNYRIQKMKTLLNSPLKTVEDLFPFQVALAIRDMEAHSIAVQNLPHKS